MRRSKPEPEPRAVDEDLVRAVARAVVERTAPQELVLFAAESRAYFRDPEKALKAARARAEAAPEDARFGFGSGELIVMATPFALAVADAVLNALTARLTEAVGERAGAALRSLLRRLRGTGAPDPAASGEPGPGEGATDGTAAATPDAQALTPELRDFLRRRAYEEGVRLGIDDVRAELLAEALLRSLDG